jgi:hypothetical protein
MCTDQALSIGTHRMFHNSKLTSDVLQQWQWNVEKCIFSMTTNVVVDPGKKRKI